MSTKKQKRTAGRTRPKQQNLEETVSILRVELTRTEKALTKAKDRTQRWKKAATAEKKSALRARARVEKLRQRLDEATAEREPVQPAAPMEAVSEDRSVPEPTTVEPVPVPDETWTVVQLRAEARARGLTGMSSKTKSQLLAALS